jgi:hypothetical protein
LEVAKDWFSLTFDSPKALHEFSRGLMAIKGMRFKVLDEKRLRFCLKDWAAKKAHLLGLLGYKGALPGS